jgi:hypothetical protein
MGVKYDAHEAYSRMSIPILQTGNFACLAIKTHVSFELRQPVQLADGVYTATECPFQIDEFWRENIGKLESKHITNCNLFILAQTTDPASTSKTLLDLVSTRHYSLLLQGVGYCDRGVSLFGSNAETGRRVSALGRLPDYHKPFKVLPADVDHDALMTTSALCRGFDAMYTSQAETAHLTPEYLRLRKGFHAFWDAIQQGPVHERLHQFVRAIEAIIKPKQGDGTRKFKYRCQFFAGRKPSDVELLGEIYELRCAVEHLNPMSDKLTRYSSHEHDNIKSLRAYQAELLAGFIYRKILTNPDILRAFENDQTIGDLWTKSATDLLAFWGDTIDLHSAWRGRFND